MADNDPPVTGSFYQLLFSDPMTTVVNSSSSPDYSDSFYGPNPPKMLCFGGYQKEEEAICSEITAATATIKQMVSQSDSSSASSSANNNSKTSSANPNRKRNGFGKNPVTESVGLAGAPAESKRARSEKQTIHANKPKPRPVRKEKIGDRIATLQQLVSPFGKALRSDLRKLKRFVQTDTASVLQEAMCYIKFLQEQVQVLCSPYLNQSSPNQETVRLRSRGLCLVPVACTAQVASTNGADFWAPAGMDQNGISCSLASSKQ
ncbi:hypothetical protein QQ045_007009 [Rhodiola kirilowii]